MSPQEKAISAFLMQHEDWELVNAVTGLLQHRDQRYTLTALPDAESGEILWRARFQFANQRFDSALCETGEEALAWLQPGIKDWIQAMQVAANMVNPEVK